MSSFVVVCLYELTVQLALAFLAFILNFFKDEAAATPLSPRRMVVSAIFFSMAMIMIWREVDAVARKIEIRGFIVKLGNDLPNELDFDLRRYSKNEWTPAWTPASGNSFNRDTLPGAMNRRVDKATRE